jgi:predicted CopG family antitoxin
VAKSQGTETLKIEREALRRLEAARNEGESLSEVIIRCVRPRQNAEDILRTMRQAAVSSATIEAIEESASRRRKSRYQAKG